LSRSPRFGSIRQLPSGRWQARYTHDGAVHKAPMTFPDVSVDQLTGRKVRGPELADRWLRLRRAEIDSGARLLARPKSRGTVTFAEYAVQWVAGRELKPRTRVLYQQQLDRDLLPVFGRLALTAITSASVSDWYRAYDPTKPTARGHAYALMKAIMNGALHEEPPLIDANPARVRGGSQTTRRHRINPATPAELAVIVENMPERLQAAVLIAAWGGLRFGEVAELRRNDIEGNVIHVTRAVVRLPGEPPESLLGRRRATFHVGTPKSDAGTRSVNMPESVMPAIRAHLDRMKDKSSKALLFPSESGGHLAVSTLNRYWFAAREAAGRPDLRWHDLRHTQAVYAAQMGATLAELMARLGHSTIGAALRYQHAADGRDKAIAARLSELAGGAL